MSMHQSNISTSATTMSTYGINYFNDAYSSGEYSDGYQSSISPVASPSSGHYNYGHDNYGYAAAVSPKKNHNYQTNCSFYQQNSVNFISTSCSYKTPANQIDYAQNSYKLNVHIKPYTKATEFAAIKAPAAPEKLSKVSRFVQQFNQQHEDLSKRLLAEKDLQATNSSTQPPEILKKRRVAANARERRRMNNLNFAFDRWVIWVALKWL